MEKEVTIYYVLCCLYGFVAFNKNDINASLANNFDSLCLQTQYFLEEATRQNCFQRFAAEVQTLETQINMSFSEMHPDNNF